jgi:hypothetical protein
MVRIHTNVLAIFVVQLRWIDLVHAASLSEEPVFDEPLFSSDELS